MSAMSWRGSRIELKARLVPRYLWQTASIDVSLDGHELLGTGGVYRFVGTHAAEFVHAGSAHTASLSWGRGSLRSFPVKLALDDDIIFDGKVELLNWWVGLWPWQAMVSGVLLWRLAS